jgi:hypothetical protein
VQLDGETIETNNYVFSVPIDCHQDACQLGTTSLVDHERMLKLYML